MCGRLSGSFADSPRYFRLPVIHPDGQHQSRRRLRAMFWPSEVSAARPRSDAAQGASAIARGEFESESVRRGRVCPNFGRSQGGVRRRSLDGGRLPPAKGQGGCRRPRGSGGWGARMRAQAVLTLPFALRLSDSCAGCTLGVLDTAGAAVCWGCLQGGCSAKGAELQSIFVLSK